MKSQNLPHSLNQKGQVIILLAVGFMALLAFLGLAVDITMLYVTKENLQTSVDSAALAAANKLPDQSKAITTAYTYMRLNNYTYDPSSNPLTITFPSTNPPKKVISVSATTAYTYTFLRLFGWQSTQVSAAGEGESAPLDVYLVLDLSGSMVFDTVKPANWATAYPYYSASTCGTQYPKTSTGANNAWNDSSCVAKWCNFARTCDPLDGHIKPAAKSFVDKLSTTYDRIGLVSYDDRGDFHVTLTSDFNSVKTAIDNLNAYAGTGYSTNTGDGIMFAQQHLNSEGRPEAVLSIVLMSDGRANTYRSGTGCTPCPPSCGSCTTITTCNYCQASMDWATKHAQFAYNNNEAVIYTIGFGDEVAAYSSASGLLRNIADYGDNGRLDGTTQNYWQVPDETGLRAAFAEIAERIFSRLIK